ncbi:MAG: tetratricopeptide repeat protein, partial [Anaerolineae bacterium]|nr:tetratricopeptide repeat protein [Anaerolineae bacterium]
ILSQDPDNSQALNALGYTLTDRTDRHQEALKYIEQAYNQHPEDPAILDSMGWVLYHLGRLDEALTFLEQAA